MHPGAVCIESAAVSLVVILKVRGLGDQIDDIETKTTDSLLLPVEENLADLFPHLRILPV